MVTSTTEEVKNPQRDLPIGIGYVITIGSVTALCAALIGGILPLNPQSYAIKKELSGSHIEKHIEGLESFETLSEADPRKIEIVTSRKFSFVSFLLNAQSMS
uniref:Uncharacterized protein n=1 Tax=Lactuca sativa TaxID=4236 RepID=A0A9R1UUL6_LACSA|nr:hypothetical protein LSAT_V11C800446150 [Lactuca sativa]